MRHIRLFGKARGHTTSESHKVLGHILQFVLAILIDRLAPALPLTFDFSKISVVPMRFLDNRSAFEEPPLPSSTISICACCVEWQIPASAARNLLARARHTVHRFHTAFESETMIAPPNGRPNHRLLHPPLADWLKHEAFGLISRTNFLTLQSSGRSKRIALTIVGDQLRVYSLFSWVSSG